MNAFEACYWNSMQTLAWVWLGDRQAVESAGDDAPTRTYWRELVTPDGRTELVEKPSRPVSPESLLIRSVINGGAAFPEQDAAEGAILNELIAGRLECLALRNGRGDPEKVPASHWLELHFKWSGSELLAEPKDSIRQGSTYWHKLRFQREQVLRIWPDPNSPDLAKDSGDGSLLAQQPSVRNVGGRPAEFDWDLMHAEIVRVADLDGLPSTLEALAAKMEIWFRERAKSEKDVPSLSSIKAHLRPLFGRLRSLGVDLR